MTACAGPLSLLALVGLTCWSANWGGAAARALPQECGPQVPVMVELQRSRDGGLSWQTFTSVTVQVSAGDAAALFRGVVTQTK